MMKTWNYIAIFLDLGSKQILGKKFADIPEGWTPHCDHITLAFNNTPDPDSVVTQLDKLHVFNYCKGVHCMAFVTAVARTDKVWVVRVQMNFPSNLRSFREEPLHITLCTAPGVPPKESNNIPDKAFQDIDPVPVFGYVGYSLNKEIHRRRPLTGRNARIWSVIQSFDFPKGELMLACRDNDAPITEEEYYKAERAARKAFAETLTYKK